MFKPVTYHYHAEDFKAHLLEQLEPSAVASPSHVLRNLDSAAVKDVRTFVASFMTLPSRSRPLYHVIAELIQARANCLEAGNLEWYARHGERLEYVIREHMPSGSGIDSGTSLDDDSNPDKLIFNTAFHHMNETGYYTGWTHHAVIITPDFSGFNLRITGRDRNGIKEYLSGVYTEALRQRFDYSEFSKL